MPPTTPPKALLFDIGGVCVFSPFQAILDYELANRIPVGWINFSISRAAPSGAWQRIERGECTLNDEYFATFKAELEDASLWREYRSKLPENEGKRTAAPPPPPPPPPPINAKELFWNMMRTSRTPDPYVYPALKALRASGKFVLGALSNTIAFPPGIRDDRGVLFRGELQHPPNTHHANDGTVIADRFDVFISSAHVGLRKPDPKIYELAVRELDAEARRQGLGGVNVGDVLFLDDIGANLKGAKSVGMRTLKVDLGKTEAAVRELEELTGVKLLEGVQDRARL